MNGDVLQTSIISLDFSFLELVLSTFLGFGSALLVEAIVDRRKEKSQREQLIQNLLTELLALKQKVDSLEPEKVYIQPYSTPIWRGARECGSILCMDKEPYFLKILEVFSSIEEANLIELKCFELYVGQKNTADIGLILSTLSDNRKYLKEQLEKGLVLLNGGDNQ